jgi:hypothetical protein
MSRVAFLTSALAIAAFALGFSGCGETEKSPPAGQSGAEQPSGEQPAGHEHGSGEHDHAAGGEIAEALAQLSPEDRALAEKQVNCPVSGQPLGGMGVPYKVTVEGRDVLLCCKGCEGEILANPEKYLAKLPE